MTSGPPIPRLTVRGFEVNPSPHEIAIGALEQWRRSKLSKAWKNVLVSLVKGSGGGHGGSLCIWRDAIRNDGSNYMELLQQVTFRDIQHVGESNGILRISLYHSPEEPLTFRCMDEPLALGSWLTALRTVSQFAHNPAPIQVQPPVQPQPQPSPQPKPEVNLMSFDQAPAPANHTSTGTPDLLGGMHPTQVPARPVQYQTYPNPTSNGFPVPQPHQPMYGQPNSNYGAYNPNQPRPAHPPQQQPLPQPPTTTNSYLFSQPPPLPFSTQRKSGFPTQQPTPTANFGMAYNPHDRSRSPATPPRHNLQHARSVSPVPGAHHHHHPHFHHHQQQQQPQQRPPAMNVPLANQFPQPTLPRVNPPNPNPPKPTPTRASPHRSKSVPSSPSHQKPVHSSFSNQEKLKRYIIATWALQPPENQLLKPLLDLVRTIPTVFPPALKQVPPHEYFGKWKPITPGEYNQPGGMDKILRRLRFFLHPDKLPQDFTPDQVFLCKLLWDIINDAQQQQKPPSAR